MSRALEALWLRVHERRLQERRFSELPVMMPLAEKPVEPRVWPEGTKPGPKPKLSFEQLAEMREMRARGLLATVIAAHFGIHEKTVRTYLKRGRP
jgi:DNA-binding NarL/FixJ family response regulator